MNWIQHPLILNGNFVKLMPLDEKYYDELIEASMHEKIWQFLPVKGMDKDTIRTALKSAILNRMKGDEYPFIIIDKITDRIIGSTRYLDISSEHKHLEIGWTWYIPEYWGTGYNTECKYLLLQYAFETLNCVRVQIKTRDINLRSRAAVLKIGAQFEGILRNNVIRFGETRNIAVFSIIDSEWTNVKAALIEKINKIT